MDFLPFFLLRPGVKATRWLRGTRGDGLPWPVRVGMEWDRLGPGLAGLRQVSVAAWAGVGLNSFGGLGRLGLSCAGCGWVATGFR